MSWCTSKGVGNARPDRARAAENQQAIDKGMSRRCNRHPGITDLAWRYLTDTITEADRADRESWELTLLESDQHDHSTGYTTREIWEQHREQVLADWIVRHPGTRPWCWWRFDSGLPRVQRIQRSRPFEIIEDAGTRGFTLWLCGRDPENKRRLSDTEREAQRGQFILDQRAWLKRHGLLSDAERESLPADAFEPVAYVE